MLYIDLLTKLMVSHVISGTWESSHHQPMSAFLLSLRCTTILLWPLTQSRRSVTIPIHCQDPVRAYSSSSAGNISRSPEQESNHESSNFFRKHGGSLTVLASP